MVSETGSSEPKKESNMASESSGKNNESDGDKKTVSPYLLTSSDNPGNIITQVQLKGDNYDEWARAIRTALRGKKKFGFVDGAMTSLTMMLLKRKIGGLSTQCWCPGCSIQLNLPCVLPFCTRRPSRNSGMTLKNAFQLGMDQGCNN